jgi:lanosterol synthase
MIIAGDIMIEYCYPECTTSVITCLSIFRQHFPTYRAADISCVSRVPPSGACLIILIRRTIKGAIVYLHAAQKPEGGWVGSWGICFTYATMFALESLSLVGETYATSDYSCRACEFLVRKQRPDGGWGESYKVSSIDFFERRQRLTRLTQSCEVASWVEHADTQVVQTCWAVMALMYAKYPHSEPLERAVSLVMSRQLPVNCSRFDTGLDTHWASAGRFLATRGHRGNF